MSPGQTFPGTSLFLTRVEDVQIDMIITSNGEIIFTQFIVNATVWTVFVN